MKASDLSQYGAPDALIEIWAKQLSDLTLVQEEAVLAGALDGRSNLLVVAPTSSGKTLVGEIAATSTAYRTRKHSLFLVPFRALADEHFAQFRERYADLLSVVVSTSEWSEFDDDIRAGNFGFGVMTYEKLTGLLVDHPQLLDRCGCLVIDEVQMLGDRGRGPALELLLTQVLRHDPQPQTIALSASLDELNQLDRWLKARLVMTNERPVPLEEGVLAPGSGRLLTSDGNSRAFMHPALDYEDAIRQAVATAVTNGKQVLVFRSSIPKVRATADLLKQVLPAPGLPKDTATLLDELEDTENVQDLRKTLASLVGFHCADLSTGERRAVEQSFRRGLTRVVVATTTLAMGVNLPTDLVILGDHKRYFPDRGGWRTEDYSVAEYKNAAGRAGRFGLRTDGLAVLVAEKDEEQRQLCDYYCRGRVEPVTSRLSTERFGDVVFDVLCARLANDETTIVDFVAHTFAYLTLYEIEGGLVAVEKAVSSAVAACEASGLIARFEGVLAPTAIGLGFARRGVPLAGAMALATLAQEMVSGDLSREEMIYGVAALDELFDQRPYIQWDRMLGLRDPRPSLGSASWPRHPDTAMTKVLYATAIGDIEARALLRSACLLDWMGGVEAEAIASRYSGCPTSRVRDMGRAAAWLLEALEAALTVSGATQAVIDSTRAAVLEARFGLPGDLAPLARLGVPGVGRSSLKKLFDGDKGRRLFDPDIFLDAEIGEFEGQLRPIEVERIRAAIIADRGETTKRRLSAHVARAHALTLDARLIADLYQSSGIALEHAVADALAAVGLRVTRIARQKMGEEDLQVDHPTGVVVVSVTASEDKDKRVRWNKAKAVLGAGVGLNPIAYVCVGRPGFHSVAERLATEMAREQGARRLLLLPVDVLAEMILRVREGAMTTDLLGDYLALHRGVLTIGDLLPTAGPSPTQAA